MTPEQLDDRLRQAQSGQLNWIETDLASRDRLTADPMPSRGSSSGGRYRIGLAAAAVLAAVLGLQAMNRSARVVDIIDPAMSVSGTTVPSTIPDDPTVLVTDDETSIGDVDAGTDVKPSTSAPQTSGLAPISYESIQTEACDSGLRAPLEKAGLQYVSELSGWNHKENLVDEQDAEGQYSEWEPNFPELVTVEIQLSEPVLATAIRLVQFSGGEVKGDITVEIDKEPLTIALTGVGGWAEHVFAEPKMIETFSVSRQRMESNITEVFVCVAP